MNWTGCQGTLHRQGLGSGALGQLGGPWCKPSPNYGSISHADACKLALHDDTAYSTHGASVKSSALQCVLVHT